jgi:vitamin B12 transporter
MIPAASVRLPAGLFFALVLAPAALVAQEPPTREPVRLDTLPVLGSRTSAELPLRTRGVEVLDRSVLERLPVRSVADALRWATGVELSARSPAQADLQIRGGTFEQVLVLVDGVRMSDPQTGHFDLDLAVPLDRVERIEILRGPASAQYGSDAVGGVVNVVTRGPAPGLGGRLEGGSFGTATLALEGGVALGGGVTLDASAESARSDGHREGTDWDQRLAALRLAAPLAGGVIHAEAGGARRDFGADDFYAPFPSFEATRTQTASLAWRPAGSAGVRVEPRITWRSHDDDFTLIRENPPVYRNIHTSSQLGGDLAVRFSVASTAVVAVGGEVARHRLESNALGDRSEDRGALFAEVTARPAPAMDLSLGLRHDRHERWGGTTSPSVAMAWALAPGARVRASWGRSFRGPTWTERFYADPGHLPNPDVRPERGEAFELGLHLGSDAGGPALALAAHTRTTRDLVDWARTPTSEGAPVAPWIPRNVNEARFRGVEAEGRWSPAPDTRLSLAGALLRVEADGEPGFESKYALRPLTEKVTLGWDQALPGGLRMAARGTLGRRGEVDAAGSGAPLTPAEPTFRELDLRVDLPLSLAWEGAGLEGGRIYLDLRNLLDADHPDLTGNPVPGRALTLGVAVGRRR